MGYARKNLVSLQDTPYYHCIARCVRRAWLWGTDEYAGRDYSHRKQWVIERLTQLCGIFPIEVCAYAWRISFLSTTRRTKVELLRYLADGWLHTATLEQMIRARIRDRLSGFER
jgi:hypothetical protein